MTTPAMAGQLVPDEVWDAIQPLLPAKPPHPKGGRPWIEDRAVLGGIIDVLRAWQQAGVWEALHHRLRRAVGCLDVAICADLVDPGGVNISERWESQAALETLRSSGPDTEQRPAMLTVSVQEYDIADVRPVFGKGAE